MTRERVASPEVGDMGSGLSRVGVLLSGRGSNLRALVEQASGYAVVAVASDNPDAAGLAWAQERGLQTFAARPERGAKHLFEEQVDAFLRAHRVQLVALAGYMRLLSPTLVARWPGRILNIHPSLLPRYKGLDTHARAIAAGDAEAGCSVHLVTDELDAGTVLGQARVPVLPGDTPDALAARVLAEEHRLYPRVLADYARAMTDPLARVRQIAAQLPGVHEQDGQFLIERTPFLRCEGMRLFVRDDAGQWEPIDLAPDCDWPLVEDRIAHSWELVAPPELLEAGGR